MSSVVATVEALIAARKTDRPVPWSGSLVSSDIAEAAEVQAGVARALGAEIAAWKVALRDGVALGAPIYRHTMHRSGHRCALPSDGAVRIEAEIAVRLGRDLPPREKPYARDEVLAAIEEVIAGIEMVETRIADKEPPFVAFLADNMANGGYVAGTGIAHWRGLELGSRRCRVIVGGGIVHDKVGGHPLQDPLLPLVAYAAKPMDRLGGLSAGQIVTTGSLCGIIAIDRPADVTVEITDIGTVRMSVV